MNSTFESDIYKIAYKKCQKYKIKKYIGETSRNLKKRTAEHKNI